MKKVEWYHDFIDLKYRPKKTDLKVLYYFEPAAGITREDAIGRIASEETRLKMSLRRQKEKHWHWKKDRTQIIGRHNRNIHDPEYKQWRKNVCNRDGWKCKILNQDCKGQLEVHHILGWKSHPELRYEVNNGITLCHFHHPRKRKDEMRLSPYFQKLVNTIMH